MFGWNIPDQNGNLGIKKVFSTNGGLQVYKVFGASLISRNFFSLLKLLFWYQKSCFDHCVTTFASLDDTFGPHEKKFEDES